MPIKLAVTFAEKEEAKAMGARWNPEQKTWYIPDHITNFNTSF